MSGEKGTKSGMSTSDHAGAAPPVLTKPAVARSMDVIWGAPSPAVQKAEDALLRAVEELTKTRKRVADHLAYLSKINRKVDVGDDSDDVDQ